MLIPKRITGVKRFILISLVTIMLVAIVFVIYDHFFREDLAIKRSQRYGIGSAEVFQAPPIDTSINRGILNSQLYAGLEQYGSLPIDVGRTGRDNPFERIIFSE